VPVAGKRSRTALILSPFASHPADAGHRRRVLQTTRMLRDAGYEITFLLYAFELPWYWRFDDKGFRAMQAEWKDVQIFYPSPSFGGLPQNGETHGLDEWWDEALGEHLERMFRVRTFDAMIVHNVWLSKAFTYAPKSTIKILETHDIFWKRGELYKRLGRPIDFFTPTREDELAGLDRADASAMVTDEELHLVRGRLKSAAFTLPTYEPEARLSSVPKTTYLHKSRVTFGMLGSGHVFNIMGLQRLLDALTPLIAKTYAPVDIVIGGDVGNAVTTRLPIRRLGYVEDEADFFNQVDFVIAPLFEGTGFKVKVADAVIFQKPLLSATHAAEGTYLSSRCCYDTPQEMAEALVRVALERPALSEFVRLSMESSQAMAEKTEEGHAIMRAVIESGQPSVFVDMSLLDADKDIAAVIAYLSYLRPMSRFGRVYVAPPAGLEKLVRDNAMSGTVVVTVDELVNLASETPRALRLRPKSTAAATDWLADNRWGGVAPEPGASSDAVAWNDLMPGPMVHPDIQWIPFMSSLQRRLSKALQTKSRPRKIVFLEDSVGDRRPGGAAQSLDTLFVNISLPEDFSQAVMWMFTADHKSMEVVWAANPEDGRRQFIFELAIIRRLDFWGIDGLVSSTQALNAADAMDTLYYTFDLTFSEIASAI
jgi:hypothetical protein